VRILCMCEGGNVRSVACAYVLKYKYGQDALAISSRKNNLETHQLLWGWADRIIVMQPEFKNYILPKHHHKVMIYDVGPDQWGNCLHPDLLEIIESHIGHDELFVGKLQ